MIQFAGDTEMQKVDALANVFYARVLEEGDEPAFVSDEATVFDISSSTSEYLVMRIEEIYGRRVTVRDLHKHFWFLLRQLNQSGVEGDPLPRWSKW